jgi:histidinol-phosphate/aromatic aminotransferase/cobyric acid decarboxylase-like protein
LRKQTVIKFNIASLQSFKKQLGDYYGVGANQVIITAGSGEGLNVLARHFSKEISLLPIQHLESFRTLPGKIGTELIEDSTHNRKST